MKIINAVIGYKVISELMDLEFNYGFSHSLLLAEKMLLPHFRFFVDEEKKLAETYGTKDDESGELIINNNAVEFGTAENAKAFSQKRDELYNVEVDITPVKAPAPNLNIKANTLKAIEGIIEIRE